MLSAEKSATVSEFKCNYDAPQLPLNATEANIMLATWAHNLLSIAKFCDNECEVLFTEDSVTVTRHGKVLLTGVRDVCRTNLWSLPLKPAPRDSQDTDDAKHEHPHCSHVAHHTTSKAELLQHLHAACFSPKPTTWMKEIENEQFKSWPGLTKSAVKNYLPSAMATAKGHLDRQRKNRKSTRVTFKQDIELDKMIKQETKDDDEPIRRISKRLRATANRTKNDAAHLQLFLANTHKQSGIERPSSPTSVTQYPEQAQINTQQEDPTDAPAPTPTPITDPNVYDATDDLFPAPIDRKTNSVFAFICLADKVKNTIYSDLTGRFPFTSSEGHKHILVACEYDGNSVFTEPLKSRDDVEALQAHDKIYATLKKLGRKPALNIVDNEASTALKRQIEKSGAAHHLVEPHNHMVNAAERAIRTFKNHFIAGSWSADPHFPISQWHKLLEQATLTLNLLRTSRINSLKSAHADLFGDFDFNKTPLAPPGTRALMYEDPATRYALHDPAIKWFLKVRIMECRSTFSHFPMA